MSIELRWITPRTDPELYAAERRLRYEVLRRPLGMPEGSEENAAEARLLHCVAIEPAPKARPVLDEAERSGAKEERGSPTRARARPSSALGDRVVGCVLWLEDPSGQGGKLLQMAVAEGRQGEGIGRMLVRELERKVKERGVRVVRMHARETAIGFYAKLGYTVTGEPFTEVGIPHRLMHRSLS